MVARVRHIPRPGSWWFVVAAVAVLVIDRVAKWQALTQWGEQSVKFGTVQLTLLLNPGIAFSLPFATPLFVAVTTAVLAVLIGWLVVASRRRSVVVAGGLLLIVFGAGSNLADRFLYGGVVDYCAVWILPVFNIADLLVLAGVGILLVQDRNGTRPATKA